MQQVSVDNKIITSVILTLKMGLSGTPANECFGKITYSFAIQNHPATQCYFFKLMLAGFAK